MRASTPFGGGECRAPLLEECLQHHRYKEDPRVMLGTCGAIGERAQVILMWMRALGRWERLSPTKTRNHEVRPKTLHGSWHCDSRMSRNTSIGGVGKKLWDFEWGAA